MDQTVVGLFATLTEAQQAVSDLNAAGFSSSDVTVTSEEQASTLAADQNAPAKGGFWSWLTGAGIPENEAGYYAEGVRRKGTLVSVHTTDALAKKATDIMSRHHVINVDQQGEQWKASGWTGYDEKAAPYTGEPLAVTAKRDTTAKTTVNTDGKTVLPVVEEELQIGKRTVEGGGVRVYTRVTSRPVEEQITLHQERVTVDRRPVDRAVTAADTEAFKDQSIEMTERSEEAVVSKSARVIEEVVIGKEATDRTDTVRDTVRRTDVQVKQLPGANKTVSGTTTVKTAGYDTYTTDFRSNYDTSYAKSGYSYDQFAPAYRYGYDLAQDERYSTGDWNTVSPQVQAAWEQRNPGTWDQFKNAIMYARDKARNALKGNN